ncbi:hypothetical protein BPOR_0709g00080 [Botrytis porri]|uniref:Uncharacterized protein n=1 Tax=Botrytis porri TaxID=87229 RepID=A0A4Z1KFV3_9HELO|nr:hypothetical protein BPOR_0709g00080 [Botrytis porri]
MSHHEIRDEITPPNLNFLLRANPLNKELKPSAPEEALAPVSVPVPPINDVISLSKEASPDEVLVPPPKEPNDESPLSKEPSPEVVSVPVLSPRREPRPDKPDADASGLLDVPKPGRLSS